MVSVISRLVLRYHRWLGLLAALPVLLWGLSGLSHPVMTRLQPQPAAQIPPAALLAGPTAAQRVSLPPLADLLQHSGIETLTSARLLQWQGRPVWQLQQPGQAERSYVDAATGAPLPGLDRTLAVVLARHYAGEETRDIVSAQLVTAFTPEYAYVNRLLPVWRVEFAGGDHLRAYVETAPMRLATLDNNAKASFGKIFRTVHSWLFIGNETLRDALMATFLLFAFCSAVGGLWLYGFFLRRPVSGARARPVRRWHRRLGLLVAASTLMFTGSATLHLLLLDKSRDDQPSMTAAATLRVADLKAAPAQLPLADGEQLQLLPFGTTAVWRVSPPLASQVGSKAGSEMAEHAHHHHGAAPAAAPATSERYFRAEDGEPVADGNLAHARLLAAQLGGLPANRITGVALVTKFEGEYGFVNKRLPVYRVAFDTPDHLAVYVETATGVQAAAVRDPQRLEGFTFAYLHKWHFLDGLGKNARDVVAGLFALLNVVIVLLGLCVFWRRRREGAGQLP